MDEARAREILGRWITENNSLIGGDNLAWHNYSGAECVCLDDYFTADQLEAIAWWMRNKGVK